MGFFGVFFGGGGGFLFSLFSTFLQNNKFRSQKFLAFQSTLNTYYQVVKGGSTILWVLHSSPG